MRKTGRKARREEMSPGRIEYIEAARQRLYNRRLRRTALLVALVAAVVIYLTGVVNTSIMALEDLTDTVRIALMPEQGFPQQTGAGEVYQAEQLGGSFVVLGSEGCTVFADSGARLNTVGAGYARPALAAGKVVLCDRFFDSTMVYQGYARGLDLEMLERINAFSCRGLKPDLTILLDIEPELGMRRTYCHDEAEFIESNLVIHRINEIAHKLLCAKAPRHLARTQPLYDLAVLCNELGLVVAEEERVPKPEARRAALAVI